MKLKNIFKIVALGALGLTLAACGGKKTKTISSNDDGNKKIVVWTFNEDLKFIADKYKETHPNREVEVVIIEASDYAIKATSALRGKSSIPDIVVGEADWIIPFYEAGYLEDLTLEAYGADKHKDDFIPYVYQTGTDKDGILRMLAYQTTPGGVYYRRDIAKKVWGNDDPKFIGEKLSSISKIKETAEELDKGGIKIFPETGSLRYFSMGEDVIPWVKDNDVTLSETRVEYFDVSKELYEKKQVAFAGEWSPGWFAGMNGAIPFNANGKDETVDIFGYTLPTWGMIFFRNSGKDMSGNWGVTTGPNPYVWGGTYVGINKFSKNKNSAWEFLKFTTLNEETLTWWAESRGDIPAYIPVIEKLKNTENEYLGGQKIYEFWGEQAKKVDFSKVTKYDRELEKYFLQAVGAYNEGKMTKEEAIKDFYRNAKTIYPELKTPESK